MKDILIRALKTFIQAFLGALAITLPNANLSDGAVLKINFNRSISIRNFSNYESNNSINE